MNGAAAAKKCATAGPPEPAGGLCRDEHGRLIGDRFSRDPYEGSALDLHFRDRLRGQSWWCLRTEVLRCFAWEDTPYKAPNRWFRLGQRYGFWLCNQMLKVFSQDDPEALLSRARTSLRPAPVLHRCRDNPARYVHLWRHHPEEVLRSALHYGRCSLHLGRSLATRWHALPSALERAFWLAALPAAWIHFLRDRRRLTIKR